MTPIAPHLTTFLRVRLPLECNASPHTWSTYAYAFQLLLGFASRRRKVSPSRLKVEDLDADLVMAFLRDLETTRGNGIATRNARLAAIKSFFRFIEHRVPSALDQVRRIVAIPTKKSPTGLVAHLTKEEAQALLDVPTPSSAAGVRDRAMLHLAVSVPGQLSVDNHLIVRHAPLLSREFSTPWFAAGAAFRRRAREIDTAARNRSLRASTRVSRAIRASSA